jgi:hypothetical protein
VANEESTRVRLGPGALPRTAFKEGDFLSSRDLAVDQRYRLQRLRRHLRYLHDWGVVCGLWVVPANDPTQPWSVLVCPGYAIGPYGDEIAVPRSVAVDVRDYLWARPEEAIAGQVDVAYLGLRYMESRRRHVPAGRSRCGCDDTEFESSRLQDGLAVDVLWRLPDSVDTPPFDICALGIPPCPACPDSPYVILASIMLPASEGDLITAAKIDNSRFRRTA